MSKANPIKSVTHKFVGYRNKEEEQRYKDCCNLVYKLLQRELQKNNQDYSEENLHEKM